MVEKHIQEAIDSRCYEGGDTNIPMEYGFSKACLNVLTRDFADMHPDMIINSCSPGFILTDMTSDMGATKPPEMGTVAPLHCLFAEGIKSGVYFGSDGVRSPLNRYREAGRLWYVCECNVCCCMVCCLGVLRATNTHSSQLLKS